MKIKLDENLGAGCARILRGAGHDTASVAEQNLCSAADRHLLAVCETEGRCLVTLDLDFANPLLFPPSNYSGIAVLRLPRKPAREDLLGLVKTLVGGLSRREIRGRLQIVQPGRIREHQSGE